MQYFPVFVDFAADKTVLVYGSSEAALCKIRLLLKTDVAIAIIAPELSDELTGLVRSGRIYWSAKTFEANQLTRGIVAAFVAADDATNAKVSTAARRRNIPVNVVDRADLSTFIVPAIVDRDPLVIAIGTEGAGPVLAQGLRAKFEAMLPPAIGGLLTRAQALRQTVSKKVPAGAARRDFWRDFFFGPVREAYLQGNEKRYALEVAGSIEATNGAAPAGRISLLDICQDAELLTLKAHRLLQEADIIVHDASIATDVLDYARRDARRCVIDNSIWSSNDGDHLQTATNTLEHARAGLRVVRLFDNTASAFDTELAALRRIDIDDIAIDLVRGVNEDCTWAPLIGGPAEDGANPWRLAS